MRIAISRQSIINIGGGKTVEIILNSDPSVYDYSLKTFEETIKTVKFTGPSTGQPSGVQTPQSGNSTIP